MCLATKFREFLDLLLEDLSAGLCLKVWVERECS